MRAGRLDQRVTLQAKSVTRDDFGGEVVTWNAQGEVFAYVEPLQGRELFAAQQVQAALTTRITIRYLANVAPEWRVLHADVVYQIDSVIDPDMRHELLQLMCTRGVIA